MQKNTRNILIQVIVIGTIKMIIRIWRNCRDRRTINPMGRRIEVMLMELTISTRSLEILCWSMAGTALSTSEILYADAFCKVWIFEQSRCMKTSSYFETNNFRFYPSLFQRRVYTIHVSKSCRCSLFIGLLVITQVGDWTYHIIDVDGSASTARAAPYRKLSLTFLLEVLSNPRKMVDSTKLLILL